MIPCLRLALEGCRSELAMRREAIYFITHFIFRAIVLLTFIE